MLTLRPMTRTDVDTVCSWHGRPSLPSNNMPATRFADVATCQGWFDAAVVNPSIRLLMGADAYSTPVVAIVFSAIDAVHGTAGWEFCCREVELTLEMQECALDYAFDVLGLEKVYCDVSALGMREVDLLRSRGFRLEGIFRSHAVVDGQRHDVHRLAIHRKTWLELVRPAIHRNDNSNSQARLSVGMEHRERMLMSAELIQRFAMVSGDSNPIHTEESAARAAGFPGGIIAHGMLVAAGLSRILGTVFPGRGTVFISQSFLFQRPVYAETQLEYCLKVVSVVGRRVILATSVATLDGQPVISGEAEVQLPKERTG